MATRTLDSSPSILPLYARAAAPMIPGASLLPFVPGGGGEIPEPRPELDGVAADPSDVAAYAKVCGFALRDHLPPTYPHVLAFPLHMAVMADGRFPFGAVGLVHVENRIEQQRPIGIGEELTIRVRADQAAAPPQGPDLLAGDRGHWPAARWSGRAPARCSAAARRRTAERRSAGRDGPSSRGSAEAAGASAEWKLGGDLGRRYAAVSGDRNPIHMHSLTAKPLGFPGAIAHGMWTKARCLAALESRLPDAFAVEVRFRKPILLPARVEFASAAEGEEIALRRARRQEGTPHLDGRVQPLESQSEIQNRKEKDM